MYVLKELGYQTDYLEPIISSQTIEIHHFKHHQKYVDNLNKLLISNNYDYRYSPEELVNHLDLFPLSDRNNILFNLGGVLNHDLYFSNLGYNKIEGKLKEKIEKQYGSFDAFVQQFKKETSYLVGSGYTFLVINKDKDLEILSFSNQETPLYYGLKPIFNIDLWEHAYYLDYQNRREEYINNYFNIIDFKKVNEKYEEEIQKNI